MGKSNNIHILQNFQTFLDNSPQGVIYMSMGTMLKGNSFPLNKQNIFLRVFSRLPQKIIWKFDNGTMKNKPKNVMLTQWAPQRDILCK